MEYILEDKCVARINEAFSEVHQALTEGTRDDQLEMISDFPPGHGKIG